MDSNHAYMRDLIMKLYLIKVKSVQLSTLSNSDVKTGSKVDIALSTDCDLDSKYLTGKMCNEHDILNLAPEGTYKGNRFLLIDVPMWETLAFGLACFILGAAVRKPPSVKMIKKIKKTAEAVCEIATAVKEMAAAFES